MATIAGTGLISAKGGTNWWDGKASGGGRIAIYYETNAGFDLENKVTTAYPSASVNAPSPGTVYLQEAGGQDLLRIVAPEVPAGSRTPLLGAALSVDRLLISGPNVYAAPKGPMTIDASQLTVSNGATLEAAVVDPEPAIVSDAITIMGGATLTQRATTTSQEYRLRVLADTISVDATSAIDVTGKGYLSTYTVGNTTAAGARGNAGGSYGGLGTRGSHTQSRIPPVYGDPLNPTDLGSGNGDVPTHPGGDGWITASETWDATRVHAVEKTATVASGVTLTMAPGTIVKLASATGLVVANGGIVNAPATQAQPIIITPLADDTAGGDTNLDASGSRPRFGDTTGIAVQGTGQANLTDHVQLRYAAVTHAGTISTSQVWPAWQMHRITGNLTLADGATLTIDPGAVVKLNDDLSITVQAGAHFHANGSVAQPIIFTSIHDDTVGGDANANGSATKPAAGDWLGIYADGGDARLRNVQVLYAGGSTSGTWNKSAALRTRDGGTLSLDSSLVRDAFFDGIRVESGRARGGPEFHRERRSHRAWRGCRRLLLARYHQRARRGIRGPRARQQCGPCLGLGGHRHGRVAADRHCTRVQPESTGPSGVVQVAPRRGP